MGQKGNRYFKRASVHDIYLILVEFDVCAELYSPEVKVSVIFSGTVGFPPYMEGH